MACLPTRQMAWPGKMGAVKGRAGPSQRRIARIFHESWRCAERVLKPRAMMTTRLTLACTAASLCLGGCASTSGDYPSLAIRDAERVTGTMEPAGEGSVQTSPAPAPEGLGQQLAQLASAASAAHADFLAAAPQAERLVSAGAGAGVASDRWAAAQVALADLDSARSRAAVSLGDLDLLYADATLAWQEREAITAARDEVTGMIAEEDAILARLRNRIGS